MSDRGKGLGEYRAKRSADRTPEPFTPGASGRPGLFVVQCHAATSRHYDLRLEFGGVLKSWAVPKGPSADPKEKRLAVFVEDHPVDYGDFEGIIPEGNYGAGAVIVWDKGTWVPLEPVEEGFAKGKLLFELRGYKLRGVWTLFRTKQSDKSWLLMKKPDAHAVVDGPMEDRSVFSGLLVEELKQGAAPAEALIEELDEAGMPQGEVDPAGLELMLARTREEPFDDDDWLFEVKYDGFRLIAARRDGEPFLRYRHGHDATGAFPELAVALARLPFPGLVLDGEVVVLDETARPRFGLLQERFQLKRPRDIQRATVRLPATYFAFDLLAVGGYDLRGAPLERRKGWLKRILPPIGPFRFSDHYAGRGTTVFEQVEKLGFEGIVAKQAAASYRGGRSDAWLKIRVERSEDFIIVGSSPPKGARSGFGALHLGIHDDGELVYAGRVGTGFDQATLDELEGRMSSIRREDPPCGGDLPSSSKAHTWVEPRLVCEVRYKEWTRAGQLRHPVFVGLREDKEPAECVRLSEEPHAEPTTAVPATPRREVSFTNLQKPFWPEEGYTKGDLIDYYRKVSPWLLPYLADRPIVLTRYPDGIHGKSFFQKDAPGFVPDWIRTETMWSEHAKREIHYFVCDNEETLLYLANMGTIPLHIWSSRISSLQRPDWCILDLDPKQAPFKHVIEIAKVIRRLCGEIEIEGFAKTSGSTGIHVLLPLGGQCTYEQSRKLAELIARVVVMRAPEIATITRTISAREGKVYVDFMQNGHGRLLVSPYCVRPLPAAPVSAPLSWSQVNAKLRIDRFTIKSLPPLLTRKPEDPMRPVLELKPDLPRVLGRLAERLDG